MHRNHLKNCETMPNHSAYHYPRPSLTLSVLSDVYVHQCTIRANAHIRPGTAGSSEIIIQDRIVSAAENNRNGQFGTMN